MRRKRDLRVADYLGHMLDAIQRIEAYAQTVPDQAAFLSAAIVQDAVIRNLEVIGEAANNVRTADPGFAVKYPKIPWDLIYGMRNRISHGYFDINLEVVWHTVKDDLPKLHKEIKALLGSLSAAVPEQHETPPKL